MKRTLFLLAFLFCMTTAFAQKLLKADRHYAAFEYMEAAKLYEDYLSDTKKPKPEVVAKAADSYYYINNMGSALRWYDKLYELQGDKMDDKHFHRYIMALRSEEKYAKADELMLKRLEMKGDAAMLENFNYQKTHLDSLNKMAPVYAVNNLAVNSAKADFGTAFYGDKIVYASSRDTVGKKTYSWNDQPFLVMYETNRDTVTGAFSKDKKFLPKGQTTYHNAAATFTPDLKTVYFSVNNVKKGNKLVDDEKGTNNIQIIKGQISGDKLLKQEKLPFCSEDYSVGHPALTHDGKYMLFVSDMPGGLGETDIYYVEIYSDGTFGKPVNAGPEINTIGREMFPFIKGDMLYFSSDGHYGLGGLDVFVAPVGDNMTFPLPQNLGRPINSNGDDFAFIISDKDTYGYLSSNRKGGEGDDDIYFFKKQKPVPCTYTVSGRVTNKKDGQPIAGVMILTQLNLSAASAITDTDGTYMFNVPCNLKITARAFKEGYSDDVKDIETGNISGELKNVDFVLSKYEELVKIEDNVEKIDINPIYFDFDQYYVTPQGAAELDKVVYVMQHFPDIVIKIESHTDSRGKDDYNMRLSDDRAKSTFSYIIAKGIDPKRIESVHGYGETRLRNKCSNDVECTEEEHQLNRRSDFIIVKK
ncbi:flagellar motor protein MotB [Flavobacterium album]|uniref:Flagellar motor protein MotB n=1 Tax=Flavobacterium album TaxID=2175091 RepID=A0A2S1R351_9FLAO|nr:OmpA family protein [Flavobacterium album]AWH86971.1 flagellar motor protein MotB [Flavobacterium album]